MRNVIVRQSKAGIEWISFLFRTKKGTPTTNPFLAPKARLRKARSLDSFHSTGLANSASSINIVGAPKTNTDKALTQPAAFVATNNRELARLQPIVNSRVLLSPEF